MAEVANVRGLTLYQKNLGCRRKRILAIALLHQTERRQAVENDARGPRVGARRAGDFLRAPQTFVDERKKIILEGSVEDLAVGKVAQDPHQRPRRQLFRGTRLGHTKFRSLTILSLHFGLQTELARSIFRRSAKLARKNVPGFP